MNIACTTVAKLPWLRKGSAWFSADRQHRTDYGFYLLWLAGVCWLWYAYWGQSYDDVFLAFRYAKNIEAGYGFVFNRGEHFLGTPAPLFVIMLVVLHQLLPFITIPQAGGLISGAGLAATCMAVYQLGRVTNRRLVGVIAAMLIATDPFTLLVLGGETPLYLAFVSSAIVCYSAKRYGVAAVLLGLALMNRTEALVPIGIMFGLYIVQQRRFPARMLLLVVFALAPWLVYATWQFGSPLTNSFGAKIAQVQAGAVRYPFGLAQWIRTIILGTQPGLIAALPLLLFGIAALPFAPAPWRIVVAWTVGQTGAYAVLPIPFYHWYAAQLGVLFAVLAALGAGELPRAIWRIRTSLVASPTADAPSAALLQRQWRFAYWLLLAVAAPALFWTAAVHVRIARQYAHAWPHSPANAIYQQAGEWFAAHSAPDARIAYLEIGQIGFYSDRYIIDTLGLVTPRVAQQVAQSNWLWPFLAYKPDYIVYNPIFKDWTDGAAIFDETWFVDGFTKVATITLPPYPKPLVIYQRKPGAHIPDPVTLAAAQTKSDRPAGDIYGDHVVSQRFTAGADHFAAIELLFATYKRANHGTVTVVLQDAQQATLATWHIPAEQLQDNKWRRLYFPVVADAAGKTFTISVRSDAADRDNAVTLWMSATQPSDAAATLQYDARTKQGVLAFRTYTEPVVYGQ